MSTALNTSRIKYPVGVVALVVGTFVLRFVTDVVVSRLVDGSSVGWLPMFGSIGQTVTVYMLVTSAFAFVVVPAGAFYLGHLHGKKSAGTKAK